MGIITLFACSMPRPTPNIRIAMPMTSAATCHRLLPKAPAMLPKAALNASGLLGASVAPVNVPTIYFRIQPMTTVYPIAIASAPTTGIYPSISPSFRLPLVSQA